jgi:predicted ArsR family transcriptional regulator
VETFVAALEAPEERKELTNGSLRTTVMPEMRAIVELCRRMRTVAEIAALLKMPLGVVRVLLSDLADQGKIRVYGTGTGHGTGRPDRALLERVLSGLRRL